MKIENKRDFLGLMMAGFGAAALLLSSQYRMGTTARMGPGYFPAGLGGLLFLVGSVIAGRAFKWQEAGWPNTLLLEYIATQRPMDRINCFKL